MKSIEDFCYPPHACSIRKVEGFFPSSYGILPPRTSQQSLAQWSLEKDDRPILQFIYKAHQPKRHLEFGTWQGWGTTLCLESCGATVWTINLPDGEDRPDGTWAYGERVLEQKKLAQQNIIVANYGEDELGPRNYHRTDAGDYIGHMYREKGLSHRVHQILCDSRLWDNSTFSPDFFDSVFIDGGHQSEVVINDTRKALQVLRPGGLIMWHDFCPQVNIRTQFESVKGVTGGIEQILPELLSRLEILCWIKPSWILVGFSKFEPKRSWIQKLKEKFSIQCKTH